ncbi:hypothetical protein N665_0014s0048 [Sinapis alba]|nr:hypothetical protein N665_0014s0048 [Sinapis alba]
MSDPEIEASRSSSSPLKDSIDANSEHDPGLPPPLLQVVKTGSSSHETEDLKFFSPTTLSAPSSPQALAMDIEVSQLENGAHVNRATLQMAVLSPVIIPPSEVSSDSPSPFVPSIGAWARPLTFIPPVTPPTPATPLDFDPQHLNNLLDSFWPTLTDGLGQNQKKRESVVREFPLIPVQKIPVPELKDDGTLRFPWAARMNPSTRNLYRAAKPTFRLDGTPQFHRCSLPPGGLIHAVVNRLWGRSCRIGCRKISESSYMFHIPHESTRQWVIQKGVWHVDDCLLFVSPWKPVNSLKVPEISTIPVWVNLKNVPDCCYSRLGLSHVASGLGEPMQTHKPRLDPTTLGEAKLLVEVELDKPFPKQIVLDDKQGNIFLVDVEYTWIPSICGRCGQLGHKEKRCLLPVSQTSVENEVPEVEIEKEQAQFSVVPVQDMVQVENAGTETQDSVELKGLSTPPSCPTHSPVTIATCSNSQPILPPLAVSLQLATPQKDTSTIFCHSSPDAKSTSAYTLAGSSSAHTSLQIMDNVPSDIIINEGIIHSRNDPSTMTFLSTESSQEIGDMENDFHITEQMDGSGSVTRTGRLIKPTKKYQGMEWMTVRGRGKRGRKGRGS